VAEFGGYFAPPGSLLADIDGDGEEVEECMPFVIMPGGRLTLDDSDWTALGAILTPKRCSLPSYVIEGSLFYPSGERCISSVL
jgi:hypothetical protein